MSQDPRTLKLDREMKVNTREHIKGLPVWMLTPKEEKEVLDQYEVEIWRKCDAFSLAFKKCESQAGVGVWFKCRSESTALKDCIYGQHTHERVDEIRDEFIKRKRDLLKAEGKL